MKLVTDIMPKGRIETVAKVRGSKVKVKVVSPLHLKTLN